jgi:hypothetical protein
MRMRMRSAWAFHGDTATQRKIYQPCGAEQTA